MDNDSLKRLAIHIRAGLALPTIVEKPLAVFLRPPDPPTYANKHSSTTHYYGDVFGIALAGKFGSVEKAADEVKKDCKFSTICTSLGITEAVGAELLALQVFKNKTSAEIIEMLEGGAISAPSAPSKNRKPL